MLQKTKENSNKVVWLFFLGTQQQTLLTNKLLAIPQVRHGDTKAVALKIGSVR
jgi:hypothetical protein